MEVNEIKLLSVGVDVGSATSHLIFSNLLLCRDETSSSRRFVITDREVIHEGRILPTPLLDPHTIDTDSLTTFFQEEYQLAGIEPGQVNTGAVIITGEAAKKSNAEQIVADISDDAGKFVAATAGPNFESLISAIGSGARGRSGECRKAVLSCDIGGGTANLAVSVNGRVVSTSCVAVGGKLIVFNRDGKIIRMTEPARKVMAHLGIHYKTGGVMSSNHLTAVAEAFANVLLEVISGPAKSDLARSLMVTDDLTFPGRIDDIVFSGGVAELIYGDDGVYGDIGHALAEGIKARFSQLPAPVIEPTNKIRATVIGAGTHTLSISGSSGFMDNRMNFPIRNVPVIRVDAEQQKLSVNHVVAEIRKSFERFDLKEGDEIVALYFRDPVPNTYSKLELFARAIEIALARCIVNHVPIILIFQKDIASGVGNVIRRETDLKTNLLTLDELDLKEGDWIDIGEPLVNNQVFPVTVKSLVFNQEPLTGHRE